MKKVIRSATLETNEVFILPPGAKLLGATDTGAFTNSCITPPLETLGCYVAIFGTTSTTQQGNDTIYWGLNNARIVGFNINGARVNFVGDYRNVGSTLNFTPTVWTAMGTELMELMPAVVYTKGSFILSRGDDNGTGNYLLIQTLPSIANDLKMVYSSGAPSDTSNLDIEYLVGFRPYATMVTLGYEGMPTCPSPAPGV